MKFIAFLIGILLIPSFALAHGDEDHIFISPSVLDYGTGEEVFLEVRLDVADPITSFRIYLRYDADLFEVQEIRANTDTFPFWWSQEARDGLVQLEASTPSPGFAGEDLVAAVVVRTKQAGTKVLEVDEEASLLLNVRDENILKKPGLAKEFRAQSSSSDTSTLLLLWGILGAGAFGSLLFFALRKRKESTRVAKKQGMK